MDTRNQVLFLQQELESAQQENKLLRDTIAIKNIQRYDSRGNSVAASGRDHIELENALSDARQTIEELKAKLNLEEEKTVGFFYSRKELKKSLRKRRSSMRD